jgi:hypothetical protein
LYLKDLSSSTVQYSWKLISNEFFYIGGVILGYLLYLTGLTVEQLQSVFLIIFLDIGTRVWAEIKNKRQVLSRKMFYGFAGKVTSYMILFIFVNHAFYIGDILSYIIFGGFSLVEGRSIYENLKDAGMKHLELIGRRIENEIDRFEEGDSK